MLERCWYYGAIMMGSASLLPKRTVSPLHRSYYNNHKLLSSPLSLSSSLDSMNMMNASSSALQMLSTKETSTSLSATRPRRNDHDHDDQKDHDDDNTGDSIFRLYYNDVYEVPLPPKHRFPMKKYRMVRERIQHQLLQKHQHQQQQQQQRQRRTTVNENAEKQAMIKKKNIGKRTNSHMDNML
jgi:hypothetical protein